MPPEIDVEDSRLVLICTPYISFGAEKVLVDYVSHRRKPECMEKDGGWEPLGTERYK